MADNICNIRDKKLKRKRDKSERDEIYLQELVFRLNYVQNSHNFRPKKLNKDITTYDLKTLGHITNGMG